MSSSLPRRERHLSGFLRLPLELREEIYSYLLVFNNINVNQLDFTVDEIISAFWRHPGWERGELLDFELPMRRTSILSVSKQISDEALNVLYGRNLFILHIEDRAQDDLLHFGTANIGRIRNLRLVAKPPYICYPDPKSLKDDVWVPLLHNLNRLCIVAQQPLHARGYYKAPCLEEEIRCWIDWLGPVFRYLATNITNTTVVEIDDNDLIETEEIARKCLPSNYKKVQTRTGDMIFGRDGFLGDAEYWDDWDEGGMNFADGGMGDDWSD